jgi:hypothetical protein
LNVFHTSSFSVLFLCDKIPDIPPYDILGTNLRDNSVLSPTFSISQRLTSENVGSGITSEIQTASPKVNQLVITANDEGADSCV